MRNIFQRDVGCFTADFRDKKVAVGGKMFPTGYFFMNALNEYWKDAPDGVNSNPGGGWLIGGRLLSTHFHMWNVQDDVILGYLDEGTADNVAADIQYILAVIAKARPFRYFDLDAERARCNALFGEESVRRINLYLNEKARNTLDGSPKSNSPEIKRLAAEQAHFDDYLSTLNYYYKLGDDMNAAMDFGKGFIKRLSTLEKRDESHLIVLAMDCLKAVSFGRWNEPYQNTLSPNMEYLAIPKKPKSKNYVVGKRMTFVRFLDFLVADFFEGLHAGHYPQQCENCKRYYLKTNARIQRYCTRTDPNDPQRRTCQAVAAAKGREAKEPHPLKYPYENRLKSIRTHVKRGKITEEQAAKAVKIAKDRFDRALYDVTYANTLYKTEIGQESIYKVAGIVSS